MIPIHTPWPLLQEDQKAVFEAAKYGLFAMNRLFVTLIKIPLVGHVLQQSIANFVP